MARFLMCPPRYFGIEYEINPWMSRFHAAEPSLANAQWERLLHVIRDECGATADLLEAAPGLPDLVFTANAGLIAGKRVILSRFRFPVRSGEEAVFRRWFEANEFQVAEVPEDVFFEGAGDALRCGEHFFAGYHFRSDIHAHQVVSELLGERVLSLQLTNPRFYHLDTCFCPLSGGELIWYPEAFDAYARRVIEEHVAQRYEVTEHDAMRFGCNAVCIDRNVIVPAGCTALPAALSNWGYRVHSVNLSEYLKSGGAAKCLTFRLD